MQERVDTVHLRERLLDNMAELLRRQKLAAEFGHDDDAPPSEWIGNLVHRKDLEPLQRELDRLHPADVAYILEALPLDERLIVWNLVKAERDGEILLEVSDAVRE